MHAQCGIRLVVYIGVVALRGAVGCPGCCKGCCQNVARVVPKVIAKVVAMRGKMHAQFWVSCSDCGGRFARGSVLPRLLYSWFSRLLSGLLPKRCQECCQGCCRQKKHMHAQFGVALGVRVGWSLCAGQRVVLIVTKVVAKRIWIEHTPGRPLEFAM